jgi:hypothetical protein
MDAEYLYMSQFFEREKLRLLASAFGEERFNPL